MGTSARRCGCPVGSHCYPWKGSRWCGSLSNLPDSNSNPARGLAGVVYLPLVGRPGESRGEFSSTPSDLIAPTVGDFDCDGRKHCRVTRQKYSLFALAWTWPRMCACNTGFTSNCFYDFEIRKTNCTSKNKHLKCHIPSSISIIMCAYYEVSCCMLM